MYDDGNFVPSLGTAMGLHGLVSLNPLYAITLAMTLYLLVRAPNRRGVLGAGLAVVLAAALIASQRTSPATGPKKRRAFASLTGKWEPARKQRSPAFTVWE